MRSRAEHTRRGRPILHGLAAATILCTALIFTNPYFSILEDESSIVVAANAPISQTLRIFANGLGQHEHPPLSDLLLHFWLSLAGTGCSLVRLPSTVFYAAGILIFATCAQKIAGDSAFYGTMLFGVLWPFGFHFGRLVGWYSFCFLILGILTLSYLHFLDQPDWSRWVVVVSVSFIAITTNYYCWLPVILIISDTLHRLPFHLAWRYSGAALAIMSLGYGPLWITFAQELQARAPSAVGHSVLSTLLNGMFNLLVLFISESIAPWFWIISVPAAIATTVVLVSVPFLINRRACRFYFGFVGLFVVMALLGIVNTKRLLFISGWLLMAIGCALANRDRPRLRAIVAVALATTVVAGWAGIIDRKHYAALHFIEPWARLAHDAARQIAAGKVVVSNSPSFLFYLNDSLHDLHLSANERAGWAEGPNIVSLIKNDFPSAMPLKQILFVRGVNTSATQRTADADKWLTDHCRLTASTHLLLDGGFDLKRRYFKIDLDDPYRIRVYHFDCRE